MYLFAGFFAIGEIARPQRITQPDVIWRQIESPFIGVGIRTGFLLQEEPEAAYVIALAKEFNISDSDAWIYLTYTCAGGLDSVYGMGLAAGSWFGPRASSDLFRERPWSENVVTDVYVDLMGKFGLSRKDALNFPPFVRGFWGSSRLGL